MRKLIFLFSVVAATLFGCKKEVWTSSDPIFKQIGLLLPDDQGTDTSLFFTYMVAVNGTIPFDSILVSMTVTLWNNPPIPLTQSQLCNVTKKTINISGSNYWVATLQDTRSLVNRGYPKDEIYGFDYHASIMINGVWYYVKADGRRNSAPLDPFWVQ